MIRETYSPIPMLYLAAGASRRMGRSKALLPWGDSTIIAHHATLMDSVEAGEAWIVKQADDPQLEAELDRINWPLERRVVNPDAPQCDMLVSMQYGMRAALATDAVTIGIALVDQPLIHPDTLASIFAAARQHPTKILQPAFEGSRGHPVLLPRHYAVELAEFSGPSLREFINQYNEQRISLMVDDAGILTDLDTPSEYREHFQPCGQQGALR